MLYWLLAIPLLGLLILVHELGHFLAARWMKVRVEEFGLGYPPRLLRLGERNGVVYSLNWIPVGGFVKLAGEEDRTVEGGLAGKKPWQRAVVISAGSLMNLLLTFLLFTGLALAPREVVTLERIGLVGIVPGSPADLAGLRSGDILLAVDDRPVRDQEVLLDLTLRGGQETVLTVERAGQVLTVTVVPSVEPVYEQDHLGVRHYLHEYPEALLSQVLEGKPAYLAGLRTGDVVFSLNGEVVRDNLHFWELLPRLREEWGPLVFVVRREGHLLDPMTVYPPPPEAEDQALGISWRTPGERVQLSLGEALQEGVQETVKAVLLVPRTVAAMARGSVPVRELAGPVGMVYVTVEVTRARGAEGLGPLLEAVVMVLALLSANLFAVNLLPLPALDGGRLAFVLLEWLRGGRRVPDRWEAAVHLVGLVLLLGLVILLTWFDILRLFSIGS